MTFSFLCGKYQANPKNHKNIEAKEQHNERINREFSFFKRKEARQDAKRWEMILAKQHQKLLPEINKETTPKFLPTDLELKETEQKIQQLEKEIQQSRNENSERELKHQHDIKYIQSLRCICEFFQDSKRTETELEQKQINNEINKHI